MEKDTSYIINHYAENRKDYFNAIAPPIIQTSNFAFDTVADLRKAFEDERAAHLYTRGNNPTVEILRKKIAALEGAEDALIVGSGAAAISNAIVANVKAGDHVVCINHAYTWAYRLLTEILSRFEVSTTFIDGTDIGNFKNAIRPNTALFFVESPNSIMMELQDLRAITALAKAHNIITVLDNSYATPLAPSPFEKGIDLVVHSATKYIGGHSDTVAGVISGSKRLIDKIFRHEFMTFGNIIHPQDAWLLLRGLRTLPIRIKQAGETTLKVVEFLKNHPTVDHIYYPFLKNHPQHHMVDDQFLHPMPMFTVRFKTQDQTKIDAFCDALQYFLIAVSWGGHESLAIPLLMEHRGQELYLVRFYIGLESAALLVGDLEKALIKL